MACAAVLLERMANSAMGLFSASTGQCLAGENGTSATQLPAYHFQRQPRLEDDARGFGIHPNVEFSRGRHIADTTWSAHPSPRNASLRLLAWLA